MTDIESRLMKDGGAESKYETSGRFPGIFSNLTNFDCRSQKTKTKKQQKQRGLVIGILRDFKQLHFNFAFFRYRSR